MTDGGRYPVVFRRRGPRDVDDRGRLGLRLEIRITRLHRSRCEHSQPLDFARLLHFFDRIWRFSQLIVILQRLHDARGPQMFHLVQVPSTRSTTRSQHLQHCRPGLVLGAPLAPHEFL